MVHFSCDVCGRDLTGPDAERFVVRIAAYAGHDPDRVSHADLDDDHMETLAEALEHDAHARHGDDSGFKAFRFDLCPECHARFLRDPLHREARTLDFSKN
jgi:23S rRNA A2030 N6-methylase RlmJ